MTGQTPIYVGRPWVPKPAKHGFFAEAIFSPARPTRKWGRPHVFTLLHATLFLGLPSAAPADDIDERKLPSPAQVKVDFVRDIQPVLQAHCLKCHSDEKPKSNFRLTTRSTALKGGEHGVDIIPGQSAKSPLIHYVAGLVEDMTMPPEGRGTPLTPQEIALLRAWIDQGANWGGMPETSRATASVSPSVGWTGVHGDEKKFRELTWQPEGWNGGLEDFELADRSMRDARITVTGHVLRDDYRILLEAQKDDLGFTRFGWEQFRKYYDDAGGFNPALSPTPFELNRDLHTDRGRAWADVGLALPRWPRLTVGYEYQYRDGSESTLQWGPVGNGTITNALFPGLKSMSERVHVLKFDAEYEIGGALLSDSFRGEWYRLGASEHNESGYTLGSGPVDSAAAFTSTREAQSQFEGANTFHAEKQFTSWLFGAGGYLYSRLSANGSAAVENFNPAALNIPSLFFPGYPGFVAPRIELERESHVFSLSGMAGPWEGFNLTFGTQNEWTRQTGLTMSSVSIALPFGIFPLDPETLHADLDKRTFSQEAGVRFTRIPFTTVYAEARFQQDDYGEHQEQTGGLTPFTQTTDARSHLEEFRAGFNTSPWRQVSLSGQYRRYDNETDYEHGFKELGAPNEGYPAFIRYRELLSDQAEAKLALQCASWLKTTLSYQWLGNQYRTATDPVTIDPFTTVPNISPGTTLLAGTYNAHITSLNATLTPWRRLFLTTTLAYQNARTVTSANNNPSIAPYAGDIYSVLVNGTYTLNDRASLLAGYSFSRGDFAQESPPDRLPLGIRYEQHTLQAGLKRQLGKHQSLTLEYRFYLYNEPSAGGFNNFQAQAVFATYACRLP